MTAHDTIFAVTLSLILAMGSTADAQRVPVWSKYSNAQRVSSLHLSKGCLNPASRSDTYSFRVRSSVACKLAPQPI